MLWTRKTVLDEIRALHAQGEELNYDSTDQNHPHLMRAACWHCGTWRRAIEAAGIDYGEVSKYIRWTRELVILRIRELHARGEDLSWSRISTNEGEPALAAAAVRDNMGFGTWHDAVTAAGIDYERIARYRHWTPERVVAEIQRLAALKAPLSSSLVQRNYTPLYMAAKRRFKQWDRALEAAGLDTEKVRVRQGSGALYKPRRRLNEDGEMSLAHLDRPDKPQRRPPLKTAHPVPPRPAEEVPAPPKVVARPLRRRNKETGELKMAPAKRELFEVLTQAQLPREQLLQEAARKAGRLPRKGGYRAELHGAAAKAARKAAESEAAQADAPPETPKKKRGKRDEKNG